MIRAQIKSWRGGHKLPVPEATTDDLWTTGIAWVEIEDLQAFIEKHGPMIVSPPGVSPYPEGWFIWYNGGSPRFTVR